MIGLSRIRGFVLFLACSIMLILGPAWSLETAFAEGSSHDETSFVGITGSAPVILEGYHDGADCDKIYGWAWDSTAPVAAISVDIYDGSTKIATVVANEFRSDLVGKGNGFHAFNYP